MSAQKYFMSVHLFEHASLVTPQIYNSNIVQLLPNIVLLLPNIVLLLPNIALLLPNIALLLPNIVLLLPNIVLLLPNIVLLLPNIVLLLPNIVQLLPNIVLLLPNIVQLSNIFLLQTIAEQLPLHYSGRLVNVVPWSCERVSCHWVVHLTCSPNRG